VRKTVRPGPSAPRAAGLLNGEYAFLSRLDVPGVVRPLAWEGPEGTPTLVMEDAGAEDLANRLGEGPLSLDAFFNIAIPLADICARIHAKSVVHRAIAPSRVVLGDHGRVTLVHFTQAAALTSVPGNTEPEPAELSWISPEQTGRMNRLVDWRSDLYSLGATFYAMLTGAPPFRSLDLLELVHGHLARIPVPASVVNRRVPEALSDVVQKLLAKMPEQRYQSAEALAVDLREARHQWLTSGAIVPFELGQLDLARELPLPERLYGREHEMAALQEALARASARGGEFLLLVGDAGIGKTTLVHALRDIVLARGGRFASGKFDLRATNVPYASVVEALRSLARALLAEPEEQRAETSRRIREAVLANGRVLIELVPELRDILGDVPEMPATGAVEEENRFHLTLQAFIRAVATADRALVLFLDDLQWTDAASLRVLRALATDPESRHVLLLGGYRPREVCHDHALMRSLDEIRRMGGALHRLPLGPLGMDALVALLGDVLRCAPDRARPLAELFLERTAGNPFFVRQLLRSLQRDGLLVFDEARGTWTWDLRSLERIGISENVAELMTAAIRRLPVEAQELLQIAACVGKRVDLPSLVALWGRSVDETTAHLGEALREGLLVPEDDQGRGAQLCFRFVHDRIQQAAYARLGDERRRALHQQIGRRLLDLHRGDKLDEKLFAVVDQLNLGARPSEGPQRLELTELNYRAGMKARRSAAYGPALAYFRAGVALLSEGMWESHHELAWLSFRDAAECASLTGDHALCRSLVEEGLRHVTSMHEAADLHAIRIASATMTADYGLALRWGREALQTFFGSRWPESGLDEEIAAQREAIDTLLRGRCPEALIEAPLMTSPEDQVYMKLLSALQPPAWFADRKLLMFLTASAVRFTLERGNCRDSIISYAEYAHLLLSKGERSAAEGFCRLAIGLARRFDDRLQETRAFQLYNNFVRAWVEPLVACAAGARRVYSMGLSWGDFQQAAYGRTMLVIYSFVAGVELDLILAKLHDGLMFCRQVGSGSQVLTQLAYRQAIRCLRGLTLRPGCHDDDELDEKTLLAATRSDPSVECIHHILRLQTSYLFRDLAEARAQAEAADRHVEFLGGYIPFAEHTYYCALALLAQPDEDAERRARVAALQQTLRQWEEGCAENFRHKRLLVDAEIARVEGRFLDASRLYDQAVDSATKAGFVQDAALASELCGRSYHALGLIRAADTYLRDAVQGYARWGALGKARALDDEFALGVGLALPDLTKPPAPAALDALSLLRTAETISSEIVLDRLLGKLLEVCIQAASAEIGVLVFEEEGGPFVRAIGRAAEPVFTQRTPLARATEVPRQIIEHVRRTRTVLVLDDASRDRTFASDPYLAEGRVKSILVLPIQRKDALLGTFFFANDLATRAFTRERVGVLELLSAQIAIALENSLLFEKLNVEIEERRRAESAVRFLADASVLLAESLDYQTTLRCLSRLVVPTLADWCIVDMVTEDGQIQRLAGIHVDPRKERLLRELSERYPPAWSSPQPASRVLASGAPLLLPAVTDDVLRSHGRDAGNIRLICELGTTSAMIVPLIARGKTLGALTLGAASSKRPYGAPDLALAEELAHRAAMAIDNARLYHEAQEGIRVREEFLSIASHELKTPITTMRFGLQGLLRKRERPSEEHLTRVLRTMERQTDRLTRLIDDLLDVTRIHAKQLDIHAEEVDLSALVRETVEHFGQRIAQSGSRVDVHADAPIVGTWDKGRLEQVVANLLDNALKFGGGRPVTITATQRDAWARLTVEDQGIGIPQERLHHVFERFERAVSARNYGGFGLGLYIVRCIVEAHGGTVHADSTPGQGATFTVELPCHDPAMR
jgi:predicted ATPase/signal transduction histidine kinase